MQITSGREQLQLAATEAGMTVAAESTGLYDKDWIGDSELDLDVLKEMRASGDALTVRNARGNSSRKFRT